MGNQGFMRGLAREWLPIFNFGNRIDRQHGRPTFFLGASIYSKNPGKTPRLAKSLLALDMLSLKELRLLQEEW